MMMTNNYPIFLKPIAFVNLENDLPPLPEKPPTPKEPKLIKKNWFEKLILQCDELEDEQINQRRMEKYYQKLRQYYEALKEYRSNVNVILSETNIRIYRENKKRNLLLQTSTASVLERDVQKGRYESMFRSVLENRFHNKIKTDVEFELPNGLGYVPDFAYIDSSTGLCIDIEIDEPYSLPDRKAIHCVGDDDYRNTFFLQKGWFVIRFAEEQIAKYTQDCVKFIEYAINNIVMGDPMHLSCLKIVPRWTAHDSHVLASRDFRSTY